MNEASRKNREITIIAIGVAIIIGGGSAIFLVSSILPIPGAKYIFMSPYLSTVIFIILSKDHTDFALLKLGLVFALVMIMMNFFMGIAIIMTTLLTELSTFFVKDSKKKVVVGSILFPGYTGICALTISKYLIGGVIKNISNWWLIAVGIVCLIFGIVGTVVAKMILRHIKLYSLRDEKTN